MNTFTADEEIEYQNIKELLKADQNPNKPKVLTIGGKFTKKAVKYFQKLIREKKTFFYPPKDKYYNASTDKFRNIKFDKRYKKKKVITSKQKKNIDLLYGVDIKALNSKNQKDYVKKITSEIKRLVKSGKDGSKASMTVDLKKINFDTLIKLIKRLAPNEMFESSVVNSKKWITFSPNNLKELQKINSLTYRSEGSDMEYLYNALKNEGQIIIKNVIGNKNENEGNFFKYENKTHYDFSRVDIYRDNQDKDFQNNCLYIALKNGGLDNDSLNNFKLVTKNGMIPTCKLNDICDEIGICIRISKLVSNDKSHKQKQTYYGNKNKKQFNIGLIDNHYFIIEKTLNTRYSLEHYDEIKHLPNCNEIKGIKSNGKYQRDKSKFINTFDLVKILLENKDKLLKEIPYEILTETPYFSIEMNTDDLTEIQEGQYEVNEPVKTDNSDCYIIFFDFETLTEGKHVPYLMRSETIDGHKKRFVGENCGKQFINYLKRLNVCDNNGKPYKKYMLVAHNLRYDFSFIWEYICCLSPIISGNRILGGGGRIYKGKNDYIEIKFQDSYNHISTKLEYFGKMFNIEQDKEIMPYSIYTKDNINKFVSINKIFKCKELKGNNDKQKTFYDNCQKWGCIKKLNNKEYIDIVKYSDKYCEIDCDVLRQGYMQHRENILNVCGVDIINYLTAASVSHDFMIKKGVYDDCFKISGTPRAFIQKCVYGGRTMTRRNEKFKIDTDTADYDSVSCYPSSMARMDGVLKGLPKLLTGEQCNEKFLNSVDGYFIKVKCKNEPKIKRDFPVISEVDSEGLRNYTNDTKGKFYYVDKVTYEDCKEFMGLEFDIVCGYYYDEGRNPKIKNVIRHLFDERLKMKNELVIVDDVEYRFNIDEILNGKREQFIIQCKKDNKKIKCIKNGLESVYKLLLNSCYGKSMLKPIATEGKVVYKSKKEAFVAKNYNYIKDSVKLNSDLYHYTVIKPINKHFNNVYLGVEVLSMAKRIMNEVMCLAEDLKIPLYYTDTDSMHIHYDGVETLEKEFTKKYNRELNGKNLGQFHIDFELDGAETESIKSKKSIYLGKKCYLDILEGYDDKGNQIKGSHIRMKGVPSSCLEYTSDKSYNGDIYNMYNDLLKGNEINFDLLQGGNQIKFQYDGFDVKSLGYYKKDNNGDKIRCAWDETAISEFSRTLKF